MEFTSVRIERTHENALAHYVSRDETFEASSLEEAKREASIRLMPEGGLIIQNWKPYPEEPPGKLRLPPPGGHFKRIAKGGNIVELHLAPTEPF